MLIEDEELLIQIMADELEHAFPDKKVLTFTDSTEALEYIKSNPAALIITDGRMPNISGVDIARALKDLEEAPQVFLITGHMDNLEEIKKDKLFDAIFEKPVDFDQLIASIEMVLS